MQDPPKREQAMDEGGDGASQRRGRRGRRSAEPGRGERGDGDDEPTSATATKAAATFALPIALDGATLPLEYGDVREDRVVLYGSASEDVKELVYVIKATNVGTYTCAAGARRGDVRSRRSSRAASAEDHGGRAVKLPRRERLAAPADSARRRLSASSRAWPCVLWPHPPLRERFSSSTAVYDAHQQLLRLTLAPDEQYRLWTPLAQISPALGRGHAALRGPLLLPAPRRQPGRARARGVQHLRRRAARWAARRSRCSSRGGSGDITSRTPCGQAAADRARALQLELRYSQARDPRGLSEPRALRRQHRGRRRGEPASTSASRPPRLTLPEALTLAVIPQNPPQRRAAAARRSGTAARRVAARARSACARDPRRHGDDRAR